MEIVLKIGPGVELRFDITNTGPDALIDVEVGAQHLGTITMSELRHFAKAIAGL